MRYTLAFRRDGTLGITASGSTRTGRWRIEGDTLCLDRPRDGLACFEMWAAQDRIELHRDDAAAEERVLEGP